jgi:purine nucleoside phosphorylase
VPSIVMTGIEDEGDTKAKDEESGYIWCESPEFKTHSESDILELWGNWSMKKKKT